MVDVKAEVSPNQQQQVKRGRGRPKRVVDPPVTPVQTSSPASSTASLYQQQQPKRRGRKPKSAMVQAQEQHLESFSNSGEDASMDASVDNIPTADNLSAQLSSTLRLAGVSFFGSSMDTDTPPAPKESTSLFSSVLKSEQPFGSGGGIPGLDLDECDANMPLFGSSSVASQTQSRNSNSSTTSSKLPDLPDWKPEESSTSKSSENDGDTVKKEQDDNDGKFSLVIN